VNERMQNLERQRLGLVARAHAQRQQLIEYGVAAREAVQRMRLFMLLARGAALVQRFRSHFSS
jgi:hypothetical protein